MPVAWLLGAIQRRTHNTVGQKWVISTGLLFATTGFGACGVRLHFPLETD